MVKAMARYSEILAFHMDGWWIDLMKQLWTIHGSFHAQILGLKPDIYVSCVPSFWGISGNGGYPLNGSKRMISTRVTHRRSTWLFFSSAQPARSARWYLMSKTFQNWLVIDDRFYMFLPNCFKLKTVWWWMIDNDSFYPTFLSCERQLDPSFNTKNWLLHILDSSGILKTAFVIWAPLKNTKVNRVYLKRGIPPKWRCFRDWFTKKDSSCLQVPIPELSSPFQLIDQQLFEQIRFTLW